MQKIAPDFLQKQQQKSAAKVAVHDSLETEGQEQEKSAYKNYTADDVIVVLKRTGDRQDCPAQLVSALKDTFNQFPKSVRYLLGWGGSKIYITPSTVEMTRACKIHNLAVMKMELLGKTARALVVAQKS